MSLTKELGDVCVAARTKDLPAICVLSESASDLDLRENSRVSCLSSSNPFACWFTATATLSLDPTPCNATPSLKAFTNATHPGVVVNAAFKMDISLRDLCLLCSTESTPSDRTGPTATMLDFDRKF